MNEAFEPLKKYRDLTPSEVSGIISEYKKLCKKKEFAAISQNTDYTISNTARKMAEKYSLIKRARCVPITCLNNLKEISKNTIATFADALEANVKDNLGISIKAQFPIYYELYGYGDYVAGKVENKDGIASVFSRNPIEK